MSERTGSGIALAPGASPTPRLRRLPYIPGLDGLRALAVAAVLLYHLDLPWIPGGFLGVDVFFVLSGFLITTLIVEEIEDRGRLNFRRFYLRRAVRLLPALWFLMLVIWAVAIFAPDLNLGDLREDLRAAFLYVSNWQYIVADTSYFDFVGRPPALQHLWSLAVEEQFYLIWPAIAAFAMMSGRKRVRRIAVIGAVLSAGWMAWLSFHGEFPVPNDPSRAYFGTDSHAMGLLVGAALAASYSPWRTWSAQRGQGERNASGIVLARAIDAAGVLALAGVVAAFLCVSEFSMPLYRGGFLLVSLVVAVLLMALVHPASLLSRAMGLQPLRYLGRRSYGIYLWHWPIFVVTRPGFELAFDGFAAMALRIGLTLVAAELSYRLVEQPVRRLVRRRQRSGQRFVVTTPQWRLVSLAVLVTAVAACTAGVSDTAAKTVLPRLPSTFAAQPPSADEAPGDTAPLPNGPGWFAPPAQTTPTATPATATGTTDTTTTDTTTTDMPATATTTTDTTTTTTPATATATTDIPPTDIPPTATTDMPATASATDTTLRRPQPLRPKVAKPPAHPLPAPRGSVSAFGDSVMLGAKAALNRAGISVTAREGVSFAKVSASIEASLRNGHLGQTVIIHAGNNGAISEKSLRSLLRLTQGRRTYLLNLKVPRRWESYDNKLFVRMAHDYPWVRLLDWRSVASANPGWLYDDHIHLSKNGAQGYTRWLASKIR